MKPVVDPRPTQAGFTLIEVMLAMGILALGMTAVLGLFTFGAALTQASVLRTQSATAIETITQELPARLFPVDNTGLPSVPEGDGSVSLEDQRIEALPALRYRATAWPVEGGPPAEDGGPLEYDVEVEVFFHQQGVRRARTFHTRVLRQRTFAERMRARFPNTP